jgi:hypothetical protein
MNLRVLKSCRVAAVLLLGTCFGVGLSAAPAAACGYGCYAPRPVVVQPYYYQSCSCCGCGGYAYAAPFAYAAPYAYAAAYGYDEVFVGPRFYGPRWRRGCWNRGC